MTPGTIVAWSEAMDAAGKRDAMGMPFTSWLVARRHPDGSAVRDQLGNQVFETQAEFRARECPAPFIQPSPAIGQTLSLF